MTFSITVSLLLLRAVFCAGSTIQKALGKGVPWDILVAAKSEMSVKETISPNMAPDKRGRVIIRQAKNVIRNIIIKLG